MIVVDDVVLLAVLADQDTPALQPIVAAGLRGEVFTTGSWYWRLSRALARPGRGSLSRTFSALSNHDRRQVQRSLAQLPPEIGMLPLRRLVPIMAVLPGQPNHLTAEAVAAAVVLDARLTVTSRSELLNRVASGAGVEVDLVVV